MAFYLEYNADSNTAPLIWDAQHICPWQAYFGRKWHMVYMYTGRDPWQPANDQLRRISTPALISSESLALLGRNRQRHRKADD